MNDRAKRFNLKKKIAFLLALSIASGCTGTTGLIKAVSDIDAVATDNHSKPESIGRIDITFGSALFISDTEFSVELTGNNEFYEKKSVIIGNSAENKVSFENLPDGEYALTVNAEGFAEYKQEINVQGKMYSLRITTGFCGGYSYEKGTPHSGVILIGDVDNDRDIDADDKRILIDAIDSGDLSKYPNADLNRDGTLDLLDLTLFAGSYDTTKDTSASVEEFVSPEIVSVAYPEDTSVNGSIEKMLCGEEKITLSRSADEEISEENPVSLEFDFEEKSGSSTVDGITIGTGSTNPVANAMIDVTYVENGIEKTEKVPVVNNELHLLEESEVYASVDENGNIHVHLGRQVAIKKVILTVTAMQKNNNLAEISKVEFVNGMENRIPEPSMDIPEDLNAKAGSEQFTLSWTPCVNVIEYEVKIESGGISETKIVRENSIKITSFGGDDVKNYTTYKVSVQSINGEWKSGYCDSVDVTPKPNKRPDKPDNVSATGKYQAVVVNWKKMNDTQSYNVYYRLRDSDGEYTKISGITANKFTIENLANITEYEIYVTGVNELGESPQSIHCSATTSDINPAEVPRYNMINRDEKGKPGSSHIVSVTQNYGTMVQSELDEGLTGTAWGVVDGDATSYYKRTIWDDGGFNALGDKGLTYTFDDVYKIDTITIIATEGMQYSYLKAKWWDADNNAHDISASCQQVKDSQGRIYHLIKLSNPVEAKKIQLGFARYLSTSAYQLITISDTYFYLYDDLRDQIMDLYADDLHTILKDTITQQTIDDLRVKVNTPDEYGEENSNKTALLRELETAEKLLNDESLNSAVKIHSGITTKDTGRGFSGLNAWQPLGVTAPLGETITVYVGHNTKKTGDSTDLRLIATQYHSESGNITTSGANLKVGANEIILPKGSTVGFESGGALYVQYQGNNANDKYSVRVSGGTEVPILDLYKVTNKNERIEKAIEYIEKLDKYVPEMENLHNEIHKNSGNKNVDYNYDSKNCILGTSDIMLDTMMISLPAQQILAGIGTGSVEQRAEKLIQSMDAMDEMMYLFYQHKGLNANAPTELNRIPKGHLNIRYQRMFSGAFMYASGNHIGIEWGSASGLMGAVPIESDEDGKYISGNYFGWGIAHEIGHCINQDKYTVAEITNNYFAQLAQAKDTNTGMRFQYKNIYDKVTSGTKGNCSNIATQLGMYWQLHLAYDKGLNYKTYSNYTEQLDNLFYARVDTYSRNVNAAPAPNEIKLVLGGNTDQNLMRLSCAAAGKNVLEFFERWGKTPDETTIQYAEQFEKETRAIYYVSDDSRVYALEGEGSVLGTECNVKAIDNISVNIGKAPNQVELNFASVGIPEDDILGYEVIRCTISGGEVQETPVGFATNSHFTDTITTMNNRTAFYKVTLIDKYLNRSESFTTKQIKIEHDGSIDKSNWSIKTTGLTFETTTSDATEEMPCSKITDNPAEMMIDNNLDTIFAPRVNNNKAEIIIDFNQTFTTTGLKYTAGDGKSVGEYEIYVYQDNEWILTANGKFDGSETVYFANDDDKYISTYSASSVKLVLLNQKNSDVEISEIDVLGVTGDNVDFRRTEEEKTTVIGTLGKDYKYGENPEDVIPEGSLIFTGAYKGNPAYSTVILYDKNGNIVGGYDDDNNITAQQIILADVPDGKNITDVSDGTWIYWIEPEQLENMEMPETVRVELYRVNNALTNEGQRLVSDSLFEEVPEKLSAIIITE